MNNIIIGNNFDQIMNQLTSISAFVKHLEQTVIAVATQQKMLALHIDMLTKKLITKEVCTQQEIEQSFLEEVRKPLEAHISQVNQMIAAQVAKAQSEIRQPDPPEVQQDEPEEEEPPSTPNSVILASERFRKNNNKDIN